MKFPHTSSFNFSGSISRTGLVVLCVVFCALSFAADDKDANKAAQEQLKRLQQKSKNLEQEKSQIASEKAKVEADLAAANDQVEKNSRSLVSTTRKLTVLQADVDLLKKALLDLQARQALMIDETSLANTENALTSSQESITQCTLRNQSLFKTGVTLIKKYEEKSCLSSVLEKDPLTKLKQASLENWLEEYRTQLEKDLIVDLESERLKIIALKASIEKSEQEKKAKEEEDKKAALKAQQAKVKEKKKKEQKELNDLTKSIKQSLERAEW
ncbi:MAG: hypothetical protein EBU92_10405 [Betaproteobacteria bacterium]|nr:hypothetical protein [Betaproteobacteria bacterium]